MRTTVGIVAALLILGGFAGTAAAADSRAEIIKGVEKAIGAEERVLNVLKKGFYHSAFVGKGKKARTSAKYVDEDLKEAIVELADAFVQAGEYLQEAQRLSTPLQQQARTGVTKIRKLAKHAKDLDAAARGVELRNDVDAYIDDISSENRRAKVLADLKHIKHNVTKAMIDKNDALDAAKALPPIPPPTKGSGSVGPNPDYGPNCNCGQQYKGTMTLDQPTSKQSPGFGIVLPDGYALQGEGGVPGHGCRPYGNGFSCEWEGPYSDPANNAYQFNIQFVFGTDPVLAPADSGKVMACYGTTPPPWRSPPPTGCFFLSGP